MIVSFYYINLQGPLGKLLQKGVLMENTAAYSKYRCSNGETSEDLTNPK